MSIRLRYKVNESVSMFNKTNGLSFDILKFQVIPKKLVISEGLMSMGTVMLRNESGRSWCAKVILRPKSSFHRMELTTGWAEFCNANQISVGDTVIFEFVKQSVIQIHVFRAVRGKRCAVVLDTLNVKNES